MTVTSCSNSEGISNEESISLVLDDSLSGMWKVLSEGVSVVLGTDDAEARANERPQMKVVLDYDFYIGMHEVTCGEFNALMENRLDCDDMALPATNVTYFDAVLYANARSKAEKRDTVYTYTSLTFDDRRHCTNMAGLVFHTEKNGFRLPTEAEWMLVASSYWEPSESWTSENSDYKLHKVCGRADSTKGVCDLLGNAMEWVNDWLGSYSDTTLVNYVGAPDGGSLGHRIVKGGSYRNSAGTVKAYHRGDVYTVTSSTYADYVGFRLAVGAIPDATWLGADGRASSSRVVPVGNSATVRGMTGTYKVKLAFRNDLTENLGFVDFSSGILSVTEIPDTMNVYHPEISPDGQKVAFCTGLEGVSGNSALYVRDLNASGTNLVKLDVESAAIPRWRVLADGDTAIVYVTSTGNNKDEAAFKAASTWQVKFKGGKFGTPEKLFDGAYHGGVSEDGSLAVTGARLLRARMEKAAKAVDTVWYNGEQACNVSLAKDSSKRTLFLDFGGKTGKEFVGKKYGTHERLLVADSTGTLVSSVAAPGGFTFDHSEWVAGARDLAVATLANGSGAHTKIALVDLSEGLSVDLVEGEELWHPTLWVKTFAPSSGKDLLDPDSACAYMTETSDIATRLMKVKMDYFWQYRDTAEIVIIGSSRSFAGMDVEYIESGFAVNMAYSAQDLMSTHFFVQNYILPLMPKLKVIALTLDYDRWYVKDENWNVWFSDIPGYEYDKNHGYWHDGVIGDMVAASQRALNPDAAEYELYGYHRGLYKSSSVGWGGDIPEVAYDVNWFTNDQSGFAYNLQKLDETIELAHNFGVHVVGVVYPQSPNFVKTNAWGRYGPTRESAKVMEETVLELAKGYSNFTVLDAYHDGNHDFSSEDFSNEDHLGLAGAQKMARSLDSLIKTLD